MLTERHRELLRGAPYRVHTWHFEQYEWEAVWIPGGCPHQVWLRVVMGRFELSGTEIGRFPGCLAALPCAAPTPPAA